MNEMWLVVLGGGISFVGSILTTFLVNCLNKKREKREQKKRIIREAIRFFKELDAVLREHYLKLENLHSQLFVDHKQSYSLSEIIPIIDIIKNELYSSRFQGPKYYFNVFRASEINDIGEIISKTQTVHSSLGGFIQGQYQTIIYDWQNEFIDHFKIDIQNMNQEIPNGTVFGRIFHTQNFERLLREINESGKNVQEIIDQLYEVLLRT